MKRDEYAIRIKGYIECRIVSRERGIRNTVMVEFRNGARKRFPYYDVKGVENL